MAFYQPKACYQSQFDKSLYFDHGHGVVTFAVTHKSIGQLNFGHAMIFVEMFDHNRKFILGLYDALPDNKDNPQYIKVRVIEEDKYETNRDYKAIQKNSWVVNNDLIRAMISNIKDDKATINLNHQAIKFSMIGIDSILPQFLVNSENSINCVNWVAQKLAICGIGNGHKKKPSPCNIM